MASTTRVGGRLVLQRAFELDDARLGVICLLPRLALRGLGGSGSLARPPAGLDDRVTNPSRRNRSFSLMTDDHLGASQGSGSGHASPVKFLLQVRMHNEVSETKEH